MGGHRRICRICAGFPTHSIFVFSFVPYEASSRQPSSQTLPDFFLLLNEAVSILIPILWAKVFDTDIKNAAKKWMEYYVAYRCKLIEISFLHLSAATFIHTGTLKIWYTYPAQVTAKYNYTAACLFTFSYFDLLRLVSRTTIAETFTAMGALFSPDNAGTDTTTFGTGDVFWNQTGIGPNLSGLCCHENNGEHLRNSKLNNIGSELKDKITNWFLNPSQADTTHAVDTEAQFRAEQSRRVRGRQRRSCIQLVITGSAGP